MSENTLSLTGLGTAYGGDKWALKDLSVEVSGGTTMAVLGPSGCGKSTLLKLVAGSLQPEAGTIALGGRTIASVRENLSPEQRRIGMVFQDYALWPHMTVEQNIGYGLKYGRFRVDETTRRERVAELIQLMHLQGMEKRRPSMLSGGQQQRVSIARALATRPDLLLFDEPLSNLDAQLREEMREELANLFAELSATVLYVTHDVSEALALADRILVLHDGVAVQLASPEEFFQSPASGWVANIAGYTSRVAVESLQRLGKTEASATLRGNELEGRWCGSNEDGREGSGDPVAYIHPSAINIAPGSGKLRGIVESSIFEGRHYRLRLSFGSGQNLVAESAVRIPIGDTVDFDIESNGVALFGDPG